MSGHDGGASKGQVALADLPAAAQAFHRRARIVDAAVREIAEQGYADASVADIAERAGVSRRTFYNTFAGKQEALIYAYEAAAAYAIPQILRSLHAEPSWAQGASAALGTYLEILDCDRVWALACLRDVPAAGRHARAARDVVRAPVLAALQTQAAEPSPGGVGVEAKLTAIDAITVDRLRHDPDRPLRERQPELTAFVLGPDTAAIPSGEHFAAVRAPVQAAEIEALLDVDGAGDADLQRLVREAAEMRDGPTLWRVITALQRRRVSGRHVAERVEQLALEALEAAWFFGLALDHPDSDTVAASGDARYLRFIAEHPGCSSEQVRHALGLRHLSSVNRTLRRLEAEGALRREPGPGRANGWWPIPVAADRNA